MPPTGTECALTAATESSSCARPLAVQGHSNPPAHCHAIGSRNPTLETKEYHRIRRYDLSRSDYNAVKTNRCENSGAGRDARRNCRQ